jgi:hypothetical protein
MQESAPIGFRAEAEPGPILTFSAELAARIPHLRTLTGSGQKTTRVSRSLGEKGGKNRYSETLLLQWVCLIQILAVYSPKYRLRVCGEHFGEHFFFHKNHVPTTTLARLSLPEIIPTRYNNSQVSTTSRYAYLALDPVRAALEQTAALMMEGARLSAPLILSARLRL